MANEYDWNRIDIAAFPDNQKWILECTSRNHGQSWMWKVISRAHKGLVASGQCIELEDAKRAAEHATDQLDAIHKTVAADPPAREPTLTPTLDQAQKAISNTTWSDSRSATGRPHVRNPRT